MSMIAKKTIINGTEIDAERTFVLFKIVNEKMNAKHIIMIIIEKSRILTLDFSSFFSFSGIFYSYFKQFEQVALHSSF